MVNEENLFVLFVCRRWSGTVTLSPPDVYVYVVRFTAVCVVAVHNQ